MTLPELQPLEPSKDSTNSVAYRLTDQQRALSARFLLDYNVRAAAQAVGLSPNDGEAALQDPDVVAYVAELQKARNIACLIGKDYAASLLLWLTPRLMGEVDVPLVTKNGSEFSAKKFFSTELVAHSRNLAQIAGMLASDNMGGGKMGPNITLNFGAFNTAGPHSVEVIEHEPGNT